MKLKKLFAGIVAVAMMATMAIPGFAASDPPTKDSGISGKNPGETFTMIKEYDLDGVGTSPEETFKFDVKGAFVRNTPHGITKDTMPMIKVSSVKFNAGDAGKTEGDAYKKKITVELGDYERVGVYAYYVTEVDNKTLGVTYDSKPVCVVVSVTNNDENAADYATHPLKCTVALHKETSTAEKIVAETDPAFTNTYTANGLTLTKKVGGNMGDKKQDFNFTVTFNNDTAKTWVNALTVKHSNDTKSVTPTGNTYTFTLKHGEHVEFGNLPAGLTYTVKENVANLGGEDYDTYLNSTAEANKLNAERGTMNHTDTATKDKAEVTYINTLGTVIDTGVILDNAPYIALLTIVAAGAVVMIMKKRRNYED